MNLQGVQHFKDIQYTPSMTYGELFMQNEYEMSCYNLDEANVEGQRQRFDLYQKVCVPPAPSTAYSMAAIGRLYSRVMMCVTCFGLSQHCAYQHVVSGCLETTTSNWF